MIVKEHGAVDQSEYFMVVEDVGGTNPGEPKTGLVAANFDSARYVRDRGLATTVTLSDLAAADSAHSDGGLKEVDATNCPGLYRADFPDAAYATGSTGVRFYLRVAAASNAIAEPLEIGLTPYTAAKAAFIDVAISSRASGTGVGQVLSTTVTAVTGTPPLDVQLTAGPALNDALNDLIIVFEDASVPGDVCIRRIADYDGATKVATIDAECLFSLVAGDPVTVLARVPAISDCSIAIQNSRLHQLASATAGGVKPTIGSLFDQLFNKNASQTYDPTTDSLEAASDAGVPAVIGARAVIPASIDLADTAAVRIGIKLEDAVGELPLAAEIAPGTYSIHRKAYGGTTWTAVQTDQACTAIDGLVYFDEVFDATSGYAENNQIRITFKSQSLTIDGTVFEINDTNGTMYYTSIRSNTAGGGGTCNWTTGDVSQGRARIGIDGTKTVSSSTPELALAADLAVVDTNVDTINANVVTVDTVVDSIAAAVTAMDAVVDAIRADYTAGRAVNLDNLDALVSGRATPAQVATEIADALITDGQAELAVDPGAAPSIAKMLSLLYMMARNGGILTSTQRTIKNNAGSTIFTIALSDNQTTLTVGKLT